MRKKNRSILAWLKFWRTVSFVVFMAAIICIISMAGTISGLRAAAEKADKQYRERIEYETNLRDRAVREMATVYLRLADMEKERALEAFPVPYSASAAEYEYLGEFTITAYCPCSICCGKWADGITASGVPAEPGVVAVDPSIIPLGTKIMIDGQEYLAADTGSSIKGKRIYIFYEGHNACNDFGVQTADVYIIN